MNCANHPDQDAPYQCIRCRRPICVDCESKYQGSSICVSCLEEMRAVVRGRYQAETRQVNYGGALLAGLAAGLAGAFAWSQLAVFMHGYRFEAGAALLGGLVGWAVMAGAGKKRHANLQRLALVLALFAMAAGHLLILARAHLPNEGAEALEVGLAALYAFPSQLARTGPLDWLFTAVGGFWAFYIPHVRLLRGDRRPPA